MPVELRKRPAPKEPAAPPPASKRGTVKKLADKAKAAVTGGGLEKSDPSTRPARHSDPFTTLPKKRAPARLARKSDPSTILKKRAPATEPEAPATSTTVPVIPETVPAVAVTDAPATNGGSKADGKFTVGEKVNLDGFGGTVQTQDGTDVTLKELIEKSGNGVVIFTYPRASTPGCTNQACLFRDNYKPITAVGLAVYGLSTDSPKANTTFATKQNLPYPLLCDPDATLTSAIGMKKPGPGKSTTRGVIVIDKEGILRIWEQGGPAKTLEVVMGHLESHPQHGFAGEPASKPGPPYPSAAAVAFKIADPDVKMDEMPLIMTPSRSEKDAAETAAEVGETAAKIDAEGQLMP